MLDSLEACLLRQVAHDPFEVPRLLVSPNAGNIRNSLLTPLGVQVFGVIARDALQNKPASFLSILSSLKLDAPQIDYLKQVWVDGKNSATESASAIIEQLHNASMIHQADNVIDEYHNHVRATPNNAEREIETCASKMASIAHDGYGYDPKPSAHRNDKGWEIEGSWGYKFLDLITRGGRPTHGFWVYVAPSGQGKSTLGETLATFSIINKQRIAIICNEAKAGTYSNRVVSGLQYMYGGATAIDEETCWRMADEYMVVYQGVRDYHKVESILYWEQPKVTVVDSITRIGIPPTISDRASDSAKHEAKADGFLELSYNNNTLIYAPGNGSDEEQKNIYKDFWKLHQVKLFGSIAYFNACDVAEIGLQNTSIQNQQLVRCIKYRYGDGQIGDVTYMDYAPGVGIYYNGDRLRP